MYRHIKKTLLIIPIFIAMNSNAQTNTKPENAFDFWVGNWNLEWTGKDNKVIKGTNNIVKVLDNSVIQENFEDPTSGFKGTSISVYNKKEKKWHQAWADNQGGYYDFIGEIDGDKRIFKTIPKTVKGKTFIQRMVFYDIKENIFTWDWESSMDNGKTWKLNWRIHYKRK